jgi:hypothetical protein
VEGQLVEPVEKRRGRPKGSKNKSTIKKLIKEQAQMQDMKLKLQQEQVDDTISKSSQRKR